MRDGQGDTIINSKPLAYLDVVINMRWSLIRVVSQKGDYTIAIQCVVSVVKAQKLKQHAILKLNQVPVFCV